MNLFFNSFGERLEMPWSGNIPTNMTNMAMKVDSVGDAKVDTKSVQGLSDRVGSKSR